MKSIKIETVFHLLFKFKYFFSVHFNFLTLFKIHILFHSNFESFKPPFDFPSILNLKQ